MTFDAPVKDMIFNIQHLAGWSEVTSLPTYDGLELEDAAAALSMRMNADKKCFRDCKTYDFRSSSTQCRDSIAPLTASESTVTCVRRVPSSNF